VMSVVSQIVFYKHCRPVIDRLYPQQADRPQLEPLARHITEFSLAAFRQLARDRPRPRPA
jgi:TetR/AcrR family transcriptional regulator, regulator of cefoperazone and chloramphenicol sensitivity